MALVESLLTAIVRSDGDALVLHVGERPYVVAASGQVELSSRALTLEAMAGMLGQLLSPEAEKALNELGAVDHQLPGLATAPANISPWSRRVAATISGSRFDGSGASYSPLRLPLSSSPPHRLRRLPSRHLFSASRRP